MTDHNTEALEAARRRSRTYREYQEPSLFREPKDGMRVPESWPADERFWHQLDTNLKGLYMQDEYELPPLNLDTFPSVGERRGQWAQPDLMEAHASMPPELDKEGQETRASPEYGLPDLEWEDMTKEEQQRLMAL